MLTYLNNSFPDGRWRGLAHGEPEVLHGDGEAVEDLGVDVLVLEVDEVHLLSDLLKGGLRAQGCQVCAHMTMGLCSNLLQVEVVGQPHVFGVDAKDLHPAKDVKTTSIRCKSFRGGFSIALNHICVLFLKKRIYMI